jgi:protein-tyrosine phosphatase
VTAILVVCTANICRSPMAEALLARAAERRGATVTVGSAGVRGLEGAPPSDGSVAAMARMGLDISAHRGRACSPDLLEQTDLVVTMEARHVVDLVAMLPGALGCSFPLRELATAGDHRHDPAMPVLPAGQDGSPGSSAADRASLDRWLAAQGGGRSTRDYLHDHRFDVADPIGSTRARYRRCATELDELCDALADRLWGPPLPGRPARPSAVS